MALASPHSRWAGTHLENAPNWLRDLEEMFSGGWKSGLGGPRVHHSFDPTLVKVRHCSRALPLILPSTESGKEPRRIRISEPRRAPSPPSAVRSHHFDHRVILTSDPVRGSAATARAAYQLGFKDADPEIQPDVRATRVALYEEGRTSTEAERVVYTLATNGASYADRIRFWDLANANASFIGAHRVHVRLGSDRDKWNEASRDATMPDELREAIAAAKASDSGEASLEVNNAAPVRKWLGKRQSLPAEIRSGISLTCPRNERVAYSIIGQFPHDLSLDGMKVCLDALGSEFRKRNIPFQAVIHEPVAKNNKKNWHFHLLYYRGPAEFDGEHWSFERRPVRNRFRTIEHQPYRRLRMCEEVNQASWVPTLKARWCEIVNEQAKLEGIRTRFTDEKNVDRGLAAPTPRYSQGYMAMRARGVLTDQDVARNIDSWQAYGARLAGTLKKMVEREAPFLAQARLKMGRTTGPSQLSESLSSIDRSIEIEAHLLKLAKMISSGPAETSSYYMGLIQHLNLKGATKARAKKKADAQAVVDTCRSYADSLSPLFEEFNLLREMLKQQRGIMLAKARATLAQQAFEPPAAGVAGNVTNNDRSPGVKPIVSASLAAVLSSGPSAQM